MSKYTGKLGRKRPLPKVPHSSSATRDDDLHRIAEQELTAELEMVDDLYDHFGIERSRRMDPVALLALVLRLARSHVPAFEYRKPSGPRRRVSDHADLVARVELERHDGHTIDTAVEKIASEPPFASAETDAYSLKQRYYQAWRIHREEFRVEDRSRDEEILKYCQIVSLARLLAD